jgi:hypothetical protein
MLLVKAGVTDDLYRVKPPHSLIFYREHGELLKGSAQAHSDLPSNWRLIATMQLRTPTRVLLRHGEVHESLFSQPSIIACQVGLFHERQLLPIRH